MGIPEIGRADNLNGIVRSRVSIRHISGLESQGVCGRDDASERA
jgi:hypothetical protein